MSTVGGPPNRTWGVVAGLVCGLYAVALAALVVFYVVELVQGAGSDGVRVLTSGLLIAIFTVLLALLALGWVRGLGWVRVPTMVWCALLLPVAVSLAQAGQVLGAVGVGGSALVGILAAAVARKD